MATTFKIKCTHKESVGSEQTQVRCEAIYNDDKNKEWAKFTPSLQLGFVVKDSVADFWVVGNSYLLTAEED